MSCVEHYGWEPREEVCTHCAKVALEENKTFKTVVRMLQPTLKHTEQCQVSGCRSKSETCCPCTCYVSILRDLTK